MRSVQLCSMHMLNTDNVSWGQMVHFQPLLHRRKLLGWHILQAQPQVAMLLEGLLQHLHCLEFTMPFHGYRSSIVKRPP